MVDLLLGQGPQVATQRCTNDLGAIRRQLDGILQDPAERKIAYL